MDRRKFLKTISTFCAVATVPAFAGRREWKDDPLVTYRQITLNHPVQVDCLLNGISVRHKDKSWEFNSINEAFDFINRTFTS